MKRSLFILFAILLLLTASCRRQNIESLSGIALGTYYSIIYVGDPQPNLKQEVEAILEEVSQTFSIFDTTSLISRVNRNQTVELNEALLSVFRLSQRISKETSGAFDPTLAPLIELWGFGRENQMQLPTQEAIDSVASFVGYEKVSIVDQTLVKTDPRVQLDFNAIAKGYAVDAVANLLLSRGLINFVVDIGGEVTCRGKKGIDQPWRVGIQVPTLTKDGELATDYAFALYDRSIATSGNYRNYKEEDGVRYSHIVNPLTGRPERSSLLSVSVIAEDCTTADAYATAFMVLGIEKSREILQRDTSLSAHFIYFDEGEYRYFQTSNFPKSE